MSGNIGAMVTTIFRGGKVRRFHTLPAVGTDTVASHSFGVAWLVVLLSRPYKPSADLLIEALRHDLAEQKIGDIPSPVKGLVPGFREMIENLERDFMAERDLEESELSAKEARILKLADNLDGLRFCVEEQNNGNRGLDVCRENYIRYIQGMDPQGVEREVFDAILNLDFRRFM